MNKKILKASIALAIGLGSQSVLASDYIVSGNHQISKSELANVINEIESINEEKLAIAVFNHYIKHGFVATKININTETKTVEVTETKMAYKGDLEKYFSNPDDVTADDMRLANYKINKRMSADNKTVKFNIDAPNHTFTSSVKDNESKPYAAAVALSNSGSEYVSEYIVSAQGVVKMGNGNTLNLGLNEAVSGFTGSEDGGELRGFQAGLTHANWWGEAGLNASHSNYEVGKDYEFFGVNGEQLQIVADHKNAVNIKLGDSATMLEYQAGIRYNSSKQGIDLFDATSEQKTTSAFINLSAVKYKHKFELGFEKSLDYSVDYNLAPIQGEVDEDFSLVKLGVSARHRIGDYFPDSADAIFVDYSVNYQHSDNLLPSHLRLNAGGAGAASSFNRGFRSSSKGLTYNASLNSLSNNVLYSLGIDGVMTEDSFSSDDDLNLRSAYLGVKSHIKSINVGYDLRLAKNIGDEVINQDNYKLVATVSKSF